MTGGFAWCRNTGTDHVYCNRHRKRYIQIGEGSKGYDAAMTAIEMVETMRVLENHLQNNE